MKLPDNMKLEEVKALLGSIKTYADMTKKLGSRGRKLFAKTLSGERAFTIEYFPALGEDEAYNQAKGVFQRSFSLSPEKKDIHFIPRPEVKGGMKVYVDDLMVDMSYKKVENLLQK